MTERKGIEFFIPAIKTACDDYVAIEALAQELYGKSMSYMDGIILDRTEASNEYEDVPLITIDYMGRESAETREMIDHHLGIQVFIHHKKDEFDTYTIKENRLISYKGNYEVAKFMRLIAEALDASEALKCFTIEENELKHLEIETISNDIEFSANLKLIFSEENPKHNIGGCIGT